MLKIFKKIKPSKPLAAEESFKAIYKKGFVHSRKCGTTEFECGAMECGSCSKTGWTTENRPFSTDPRASAVRTDLSLIRDTTDVECTEFCADTLDCVAALYEKNTKTCKLESTMVSEASVTSQLKSYHRRYDSHLARFLSF